MAISQYKDYVAPVWTPTTQTVKPYEMPTFVSNKKDIQYQAPTWNNSIGQFQQFQAPVYNALTYEAAKNQANDVLSPQYDIANQNALTNVKNQSLGSGFYGQLPQLQTSADTSANIEAQKQAAMAQYAQNLQSQDLQKYNDQFNQSLAGWNANRGAYESDRNFNRSNFESDRNFGYNDYRNQVGDNQWQQGFDRNVFQDDRNFGYADYRNQVADNQWQQGFDRNTFESDRNFGRDVYNTDRDYQFNVDNANTQADQWKQTFDFNQDRANVQDDQWNKTYDRGVLESNRDYNLKEKTYNSSENQRAIDNAWKQSESTGYVTPALSKLTGLKVGTPMLEAKKLAESTREFNVSNATENRRITVSQQNNKTTKTTTKKPTQSQTNAKASGIVTNQMKLFKRPIDFLAQMGKQYGTDSEIFKAIYTEVDKRYKGKLKDTLPSWADVERKRSNIKTYLNDNYMI